MGADAEIYVFDHRRYQGELVPELAGLVHDGRTGPLLTPLIQPAPGSPANPVQPEWRDVLLPWARSQRIDGPPAADLGEPAHWPARLTRDPALLELLTWLFEDAVALHCLGPSQFVGRSWQPSDYPSVPGADHLLALLGRRGDPLNPRSSDTTGIHGWLTVAETAELALVLDRLPLPRFPATFTAMAAFQGPLPPGRWSHPAASFDDLSLSFVRTVATVAAGTGRGVLWGDDVGNALISRAGPQGA